MSSEISQSQKDHYCMSVYLQVLYVLLVVKTIETESRMVLAKAYGEGGVGSYGFDGTDLQFFKRKSCGDR